MKPVEQMVEDVGKILNNHMETKITVEPVQTDYWKGARKGMKLTGVTFQTNRTIFGLQMQALLQYAKENDFAIEIYGQTFSIFNNLPFGCQLE